VKGVDWYLKEFPQECRTKANHLTLDATPSYIYTQNVPSLIANFYKPKELAQKKFILLLRDPVARLVKIHIISFLKIRYLSKNIAHRSIQNISIGTETAWDRSSTTQLRPRQCLRLASAAA
jgi:hypothetical protein